MRVRSPSSRASIPIRFCSFDVMLAALSPLFALNLRAAQLLSPLNANEVVTYCIVCFACSLIAFAVFKIYGGIPGYLSVYDVMELVKAVLVAEFMICVIMFALNRLDGIPRSVPTIHALILGTGLLTARLLVHAADGNRKPNMPRGAHGDHVILIGMNDLSVLLMKFLDAGRSENSTVVALLDEDARWFGRSVNGVRIYGPPGHLDVLIDEFAVHGVSINRVLVCGGTKALSAGAAREIRRVCARRAIDLSFLPDPFKFVSANPAREWARNGAANRPPDRSAANVVPAPYFRYKQPVERTLAAFLLAALLPLCLIAALLVFFDVGSPILFWQRRIGLYHRPFHIYKFRTLAHPLDRNGRVLSEAERLSWIGRALRKSRLDELPQLLSVLTGDMALIGPRPLLPRDQPTDPSVRLAVRPGITGWAQVNGGALLFSEEKSALDTWYIRHASAWLDARIVAMTLLSLLRGDRRSEHALMQAYRERALPAHEGRISPDETAIRLGAAARDALHADQPQHSAVPLV